MTQPVHRSDDGLSMPRRLIAVIAICTAVFLTVLDGAMLTVALPRIAAALQISPAQSVWIVNAYQLVIVATILPAVVLADRHGYARLFRLGVCLYASAALVCAFADSFNTLLIARIVQGLGSAGILCGSSALLRATYPSARFSMGVAINTTVATLSAASGPTLGALILAIGNDWRWLFFFFLPFTVLCAVCSLALPAIAKRPRALRPVSVVLNVLALGLGTLGLGLVVRDPLWGVALLVATGLAWRHWIRREAVVDDPLLPIDLFRLPRFAYSIAASVSMFAAQAAALVAFPFYFQTQWNLDVVQTGLLLSLWPACASLTSPLAIRLLQRVLVAELCALGAVLMMAGLAWILLLPAGEASYYWLLPGLVIGGLSIGVFQAPNMHAILTAGPRNRAGAAGSIQAIARVGGTAFGAALTGFCFALRGEDGAALGLTAAAGLALTAGLVNLRRRRYLRTQVEQPQ